MNKEEPDTNAELTDDVIDRVNVGVVAVSLSLYEEGMSLEELIEVTGIRESDVRKSLDYLMNNRMVRKKLNQESYHVSNFKKMLQFLLSSGMIFPLGEQFTKSKEDK
ncbi:MAG: hypothetical protein HGN29_01095 [Asgard group archaeon]|nr:hypothetical protein [Asgard group archaeon]